MSVNGKFKAIREADILAVAERFSVGTSFKVLEQVRAALRQWPRFAEQAELPPEIAEEIRAQHLMLNSQL